MSKITRLGFLKRTSAGVATVAVLAAAPRLPDMLDPTEAEAAELAANHTGALVVYVEKASTGELAILKGNQKFVIHDRKLVARLLKAAR